MTNEEIINRYRGAKDGLKEIAEISRETGMKCNDIRRVLKRHGGVKIGYAGRYAAEWESEDLMWEKEREEKNMVTGLKSVAEAEEEVRAEEAIPFYPEFTEEPAPEEPEKIPYQKPEVIEKPVCFVPMQEKEKVPQIIIDAVQAAYDRYGIELNELAEQVTKLKEMMTRLTKDRMIVGDWLNSVEAE